MFSKKLLKTILLSWAIFLVLGGRAGAAVKKGPYLMYTGVNSEMAVLWQLDDTQTCTIEWGLDTLYLMGMSNTFEYGIDHQHMYTITGLTPGTKYYYQVSGELDGILGNGSFMSAPPNDAANVKFMAYGDTRTYPADHDAVNEQMIITYTTDPDYQTLTLHAGDWVNNGDSEDDWTSQFFDPIYTDTHEFQANMPINGCKGNHENTGSIFYKYFPYPYVNDFYWSFDYGPAHIAVVDQYVPFTPGSAQYAWLENDLASSNKEWKILLFHEPGWSAGGGHGNDPDVQDHIQPLCLTYGVDIVFAGHNHYYARCVVNGVQHITTGGGGAPLRSPDAGYPNVVVAVESHHFVEVDIQGNQLSCIVRDSNGGILDSFDMTISIPEDGANSGAGSDIGDNRGGDGGGGGSGGG